MSACNRRVVLILLIPFGWSGPFTLPRLLRVSSLCFTSGSAGEFELFLLYRSYGSSLSSRTRCWRGYARVGGILSNDDNP